MYLSTRVGRHDECGGILRYPDVKDVNVDVDVDVDVEDVEDVDVDLDVGKLVSTTLFSILSATLARYTLT